MSKTSALQIAAPIAIQQLTPAQKRFNNLIRQIERARATLGAWQHALDGYRQKFAPLLSSLQATLVEAKKQWILVLDERLGQPGLTAIERDTLRTVICNQASEWLHLNDESDAVLIELFDKYSEVDFATEQKNMLRTLKDATEAMTGIDLGDDAIDSSEALLQRFQERLEAGVESTAEEVGSTTQRRETAAERRRATEAKQATQSVREVFRKLASALHPDREADPAQRAVKTEMMQQVNQAYENNDLLTLLELQLRIEQIDVTHIATLSAQRLKHYNKVLQQQFNELKSEISCIEMQFSCEYGLEPCGGINPRKLGALLEEKVRELRADIACIEGDKRMVRDRAAFRYFLKRERRSLTEDNYASVFNLF